MSIKFTPMVPIKNRKVIRIFWSEENGAYKISSYGKKIGNVECNFEDMIRIMSNDFSGLIEQTEEKDISVDGTTSAHENSTDGRYFMTVHNKKDENQLPFGVFSVLSTFSGLLIRPYKNINVESNIVKNKNLKQDILNFFKEQDSGRKNKLGILLYGPPGNGKTTEIMSLFDLAETEKMRIFLVDGEVRMTGELKEIKELLQNDKTIFVLEEVTERTSRGTEDLLTFLDGEHSWANSVTIATTNYPEQLPSNLVDRPGRFSNFIEYTNPKKEEIIELGSKFGFNEEESLTLSGQDLSFDYVSFIFSEAKKQNKTPKELRQQEEDKRSKLSKTFKGKIGIR